MRAVIAERDRIKHVLGNLTLVTGANNPSLGKLAFSKKRERLQSSLLKLNQEIARETHWDEEAIARRSARLSTLALKIWPGPVTTS